ncbi:3'-5' exonuclease [Ampullimonas aquatilis]|uniref:3'-5' exonuclease n=1 Tax=Ampullimonas aquatilis TaxID=1341549 RepID=UPI003C76C684
MIPVLVFDIETIPDVTGLRTLLDLPADMPDTQVAEQAFAARQEKTGSNFLQHHVQRVCAISCVLRGDRGLRVKSLGNLQSSEGELISEFFDLIEKHAPQLVSWNGGGFDLPVLHYRGLVNGVVASKYWDMGEDDRDYKWNNYISRYHMRHLDLMDLLAMYSPRANAPLDDLAKLCGFPGKLGMDGSKVWDAYQAGELATIRNYCETDVLNTYLVYCRFQLMRGGFSRIEYDQEIALVRATLEQDCATGTAPHLQEYLSAWQVSNPN